MPDENKGNAGGSSVRVERAPGFAQIYSNVVLTEATAWDLSLLFGRFDTLPDGQGVNQQQVAVTVPFGVAKLALYWLEAAIIAHELETGHRTSLRDNVVPPSPPELDDEQKENPQMVKYHEELTKLHQRFIESLG